MSQVKKPVTKKPAKKEEEVSLDEQIGKGLTPKLDQIKNDYEKHPKFAKFIKKGVE